MERMEETKMTRRVYVCEIEEGNVRGRPPVKWRDSVQEYVRERGESSVRNFEQLRRECLNRERWKLFCRGHPLVGVPRSRCTDPLSWGNGFSPTKGSRTNGMEMSTKATCSYSICSQLYLSNIIQCLPLY